MNENEKTHSTLAMDDLQRQAEIKSTFARLSDGFAIDLLCAPLTV
jgi:hypothetical protein